MAACLRAGDRAEVLGQGEPRRILRASFRRSLYAKTALVDGEIAAIGGLGGDILSDVGLPWMLTMAAVERAKVSFVKAARREVEIMLTLRRRLENFVLADYAQAIGLLELIGFTVEPPQPVGPQRVLFRRFWIEG